MNCQDAQDRLLEAEDLSPPGLSSGELASHLADCAACRQLVTDLGHLEEAWRAIPLPAGSERAREALLERLSRLAGGVEPARRSGAGNSRRVSPQWLIAASVLIAMGVGSVLFVSNRRASASSDVVERLVDWNLSLAQTPLPADRDRLYAGQAESLQDKVRRTALPAEERGLAESLLENAPVLARNNDPLAVAGLFHDVADQLLTRMDTAIRRGDEAGAGQYARLYRRVEELGIGSKMELLETTGALDFNRQHRLERLVLRDADRMRTLVALLERTPDSSRKEIKRALGVVKNRPKKVHPAKVDAPRRTDRSKPR
jgi:hypothetical protein